MTVPAQTATRNKVVTTAPSVAKQSKVAESKPAQSATKSKVSSTPTSTTAAVKPKVANPSPATVVGSAVKKGPNSDNGTAVTGKAVRNFDPTA